MPCLQLDDRIQVINTRVSVLHEMLNMLRSQQHALHSSSLEWIVIWLIVIGALGPSSCCYTRGCCARSD